MTQCLRFCISIQQYIHVCVLAAEVNHTDHIEERPVCVCVSVYVCMCACTCVSAHVCTCTCVWGGGVVSSSLYDIIVI